jgi:septum site-determining protein MinC
VINNRNSQNVMIKGTKDGLTLHLDDSSSFTNIIAELKEKLSVSYRLQKNDPLMSVNVHTGNRLFSKEEVDQIITIIQTNNKLVVEQISSNVITKQEANQLIKENEIKSMVGRIRSGQVIEAPGDLLLIGDVNPGGVIKAVGNIFIIGTLKGSVHAGCNGDCMAIVSASLIEGAQISIAHLNSTSSVFDTEGGLRQQCVYINDQDEIIFDRIQVLKQHRPNLTRLEGRL